MIFKEKVGNFKPHIVVLDPFLKLRFQILPCLKIVVGREKLRTIAGKLWEIAEIAEKLRKLQKIADRNPPALKSHCSLFKAD